MIITWKKVANVKANALILSKILTNLYSIIFRIDNQKLQKLSLKLLNFYLHHWLHIIALAEIPLFNFLKLIEVYLAQNWPFNWNVSTLEKNSGFFDFWVYIGLLKAFYSFYN